jgi:hypothetical protein
LDNPDFGEDKWQEIKNGTPWEHISVDVINYCPVEEDGECYYDLYIGIDSHFSNWSHKGIKPFYVDDAITIIIATEYELLFKNDTYSDSYSGVCPSEH